MSLTEARRMQQRERTRATPLASVTRRGARRERTHRMEVWNEGVSLQGVAYGST